MHRVIITIANMLNRTIKKQGHQLPRELPRGGIIAIVIVAVLAMIYVLLPEPGPALRTIKLDDQTVIRAAQALSPPSPVATSDPVLLAQASLGRELFFDPELSSSGQLACSNCHQPDLQFTDGKPRAIGKASLPHNTPTIINTGLNSWFHWDGRVDSLALQATKPIEDPREQGVSRSYVVRLITRKYSDAYEKAFGKLPATLNGLELPEQALPVPIPPKLPLDVASYALSTLGNFQILSDILAVGQSTRLAPAMELSRRALAQPAWDPEWHDAWLRLPEATQGAINEVFANVGRAIAEFERGMVAVDSHFDQFVRRATDPSRQGQPVRSAFDATFGDLEWQGLRLFVSEARCTLCHNGPNFSDQQFHNIGLAQGEDAVLDAGRAAGVLLAIQDPLNCSKPPLNRDPFITNSESCRELAYLDINNLELVGAFKTPSLRNIEQTAPYMHDGRFASLDAVLDHYNKLADKPAMGHREESLQPLNLTDDERRALLAFLKSLTSPVRDLHNETAASKAH